MMWRRLIAMHFLWQAAREEGKRLGGSATLKSLSEGYFRLTLEVPIAGAPYYATLWCDPRRPLLELAIHLDVVLWALRQKQRHVDASEGPPKAVASNGS